MGFAKHKKRIRGEIAKWGCFGYLGYGQGRAVAIYGEDKLSNRSACMDICTRASACRMAHHERMNIRYPQLAQLVESTARLAHLRKLDIVDQVVSAMEHAVSAGLEEAIDVQSRLKKFKIEKITDHYRCGQFENIQNGLDKISPGARGDSPKDVKHAS